MAPKPLSRPPAKSKASMMRRLRDEERAAGLARRHCLLPSGALKDMQRIAAEMDCHVEDLVGAIAADAVKNGLTNDRATRQRLYTVLDSYALLRGRKPSANAAQKELDLAS